MICPFSLLSLFSLFSLLSLFSLFSLFSLLSLFSLFSLAVHFGNVVVLYPRTLVYLRTPIQEVAVGV